MTHAMTNSAGMPRISPEDGLVARFLKALAEWRMYRRTLSELQALSQRELYDLGLAGADLKRVAREAVRSS